MPPPWSTADLAGLVTYHDEVMRHLARRRTHLTSGLVPVREYIALSTVEAWRRWPEIIGQVDAAMPASAVGERLRVPGAGVSAPYFWSVPNLALAGRTFLSFLGTVGDDEVERVRTLLSFWWDATTAWRDDGFVQCWDASDVLRPYPAAAVSTIADAAVGLDHPQAARARRFLASCMQHLFLLYLDTRMGTGDTGPYPLPRGRTMIIREFFALDGGWLPWADAAAGVPAGNLVCGLVFRPGVQNRVTDFGSTVSTPVDNLDYLEALAVLAPDGNGGYRSLTRDEMDEVATATKAAVAAFYRRVASWTWREKVDAGAYVYVHGLVRPFTTTAGVDDVIDWTTPRDGLEVIPLLEALPPEDSALTEPVYTPLVSR